ncbi:MAG: T9SS type A sorting domain-containing protein [Ignavibacteria bacterium]|nr:T9SS type A sorting domain-containing protein [Ignavibacteria bacterium]
MRTLMLRLVSIVLLAGVVSPVRGQIMITAADVNDQLAVGNTLTNRNDTLTTSLDIGKPGSTSWNFGALNSHTADVLTSVAPASTPHINDFPGATHAFETVQSIQGITGTAYVYLILSTNLTNPGLKASALGGAGIVRETNSPPDIVYALPSTLGTNWTSTYTTTQQIWILGSPLTPTVTNHNASYVVDAYGPMTIPGGSVHDALRIRKTDLISGAVSYIFLAKNGATVRATAIAPASPDSGIISVRSVQWTGPTSTDVDVAAAIPEEFALMQNYPNPFNPSTTIRFTLPEQSHVTLKVFNLLGEEVATLLDGVREAGEESITFDAAHLATGVYLYRLVAGDFVQTKRMVLIR